MKFLLYVVGLASLFWGCFIFQKEVPRTISGRLYVAGNEPFVHLAIEDSSGNVYFISPQSPDYKELWHLQGQIVKITYQKKIDKKNRTENPVLQVIQFEIIKK